MQHEGTLHLLDFGPDPTTGVNRYAVNYASYDSHGGALPNVLRQGENGLRAFLAELQIEGSKIERALNDLHEHGRAVIQHVVLSDEQIKRYGLNEMGIIQSIISYLSTG